MNTSIVKVNSSNFHKFGSIIIEYGFIKRNIRDKDQLLRQYRSLVKDSQYSLYILIIRDIPVGMSLIDVFSSRMINFYVQKQFKSEEFQFFKDIFLSTRNQTGKFITNWEFSSELIDKFGSLGIIGYKRHKLFLTFDNIQIERQINFDNSFVINPWNKKYVDDLSEIIVDAYEGSIDSQIYQEFQTKENSKKIISDLLDNKFGTFEKNCTTILLQNNIPIGFCFTTVIRKKDTLKGFIPLIAVMKKFHGKGLGKGMLQYTQKCLKDKYPSIIGVELAVSEDNKIAFKMYKKLGYESIDTGITYVY